MTLAPHVEGTVLIGSTTADFLRAFREAPGRDLHPTPDRGSASNSSLEPRSGATAGVPGGRRQVGAGSPGTGGLVPTLGADGPFRIEESAELRIRGGVGGATGVLTVTLVHGGERGPGGWIAPTFDQVLARIPFTLSGTPGAAGTGSWSRPFTVLPTFASETRRYVVEIDDPAAADGLARANAMVLSYGP